MDIQMIDTCNIETTIESRAAGQPPQLRKLEKLIIYSYLDTWDFIFKIRLLSRADRQLTENSAIARQNKSLELVNFEKAGRETASLLKFLDKFERLFISLDQKFISTDEEIKGLFKLLQNLPKRFYDRKIKLFFMLENYRKKEFDSAKKVAQFIN